MADFDTSLPPLAASLTAAIKMLHDYLEIQQLEQVIIAAGAIPQDDLCLR